MRMNAVEFQTSKFFDNILVSTMKYMENFAEKTRDDKGQFMKGLLRVLPQFPERVLMRKVKLVRLLLRHHLEGPIIHTRFFPCVN